MYDVSFFSTFLAPALIYIKLNDNVYTVSGNPIYLQKNHFTSITCLANGSRPEANVTLLVDEIVKGQSNVTIIHGTGKNETFDTMVTASIQAAQENGNISCQRNGSGNYSVNGLTLRYISYGKL